MSNRFGGDGSAWNSRVAFDRQVEIEEAIAKGQDGTRSSVSMSRAEKRE